MSLVLNACGRATVPRLAAVPWPLCELPRPTVAPATVGAWRMSRCLRNLSWHTARMASYVADTVVERSLNLLHEVQVPADVHVLYQDWSSYYSRDPVYKKMWPELQKSKYGNDEQHGSYYLLHKGKIRHRGKVCGAR